MFISVNGKAKKVTDIFAGGKDGKAHKITELFGSVNGVAKQLYSIEKKTNAFDQFTWDEIKQLANNGQLLEHFHFGDRVTVKLKEPLENDINMYMKGFGVYINQHQIQNEIMFQITSLSETRMELTCPRVTALGTADSDINSSLCKESYHYISVAWGMTDIYKALKKVDNALPDDLKEVLNLVRAPLINRYKHQITGEQIDVYDEDMHVTQAGKNEINRSLDMTNDSIYYPIIENSWFSTSPTEWLYNIYIPPQYDTYEVRRFLVKDRFKGYKILDHTYKYETVYQSHSDVPYTTCYFSRGITNNTEYNDFLASGKVTNEYQGKSDYREDVVLPRIIIESDFV